MMPIIDPFTDAQHSWRVPLCSTAFALLQYRSRHSGPNARSACTERCNSSKPSIGKRCPFQAKLFCPKLA